MNGYGKTKKLKIRKFYKKIILLIPIFETTVYLVTKKNCIRLFINMKNTHTKKSIQR